MQEKERIVLRYLNEKYKDFKDEFKVIGTNFAGYTGLKDTYYMSSRILEHKKLVVECISGRFKDNYMPLYFIKMYEERMQLIYTKKFGRCRCICSDYAYPTDRFSPATTFQDYIHDKNNRIKEVLLVETNDADIAASQAVDIMQNLNIPHKSLEIKVVNNIEEIKKVCTYWELEQYEAEHHNCYKEDILFKMKGLEVIARVDRGSM